MTAELVIISPELSPGVGGLADYTLRVVDEWPASWKISFILPEPAALSERCERSVELVHRNAAALLKKLPMRGGKVLVQYSAYGFDQFGYPRWLLNALAEWKARSGGTLVIMLHEIWTFWPVRNKNFLVQQLHRRDLGKLLAKADAIFTSTPSQAEHLRTLSPERLVQVLPVGSNISVVKSQRGSRDPTLAVLFGLQPARIRTLREMHSAAKALFDAGRLKKLITVGGGNSAERDEEERLLLSELAPNECCEERGALPEAAISNLLSQASFALSSQDELSLTKSGTFMAYAAHGLNVISPSADAAKAEPLCWLASAAELLHDIPGDELRDRAGKLRDWQGRTASWPHIAEQFARALQMEQQL